MKWFWLFLTLVIVGCRSTSTSVQKADAIWLWHSPADVSKETSARLKNINIEKMFVRAGTFSYNGDELVPILLQSWKGTPSPFPAHLVFNFDSGALRHFEELDLNACAKLISDRYLASKEFATKQGWIIKGIQLDIDVPTRLLPRYGQLLGLVRAIIGKDSLSITALPTWLTSSELGATVAKTDFYIPQFYEGEVAKRMDDATTIADPESLKKGIEAAERIGHPYMIGIPSYGRGLLYDAKGNLDGSYQELALDDAMRHPSFKLEDRKLLATETQYRFKAIRPGKNGKGMGYFLVYRIPRPDSVAAQIDAVHHAKTQWCFGAALFRVPESDETMAVSLISLGAAINKLKLAPQIELKLRIEGDALSRIDKGPSGEEYRRVYLEFRNTGSASSVVGKDAFVVHLKVNGESMVEARKGDFDEVLPTRMGMSSSLSRADTLTATAYSIRPDELLTLGPLLLRPHATINCSWQIIGETGDRVEGSQRIEDNE